MKAFFVYAAFVFIYLTISIIIKNVFHNPILSRQISRSFILSESILLSLYFWYNIKSDIKKYLLILGPSAVYLLFFQDYFANSDVPSFLPLATEGIFFILIILFFFYEKINDISEKQLYHYPSFWISVAFLLNFAGTFFLYLVMVTMAHDPSIKNLYNSIYGMFTVMKNILLCVAIVTNANERQLYRNDGFRTLPNLEFDV